MSGGEVITVDGEQVTRRMLAYLEDSYQAAELAGELHIIQGSYSSNVAASGSTHDQAGAADLRTIYLPSWAQQDLCEVLVVELRRRGGCAWYRDEAHGGMDPHIHVILRGETPLSGGASGQVTDYDHGRNGLASGGPDYHPRPAWHLYEYGSQEGEPVTYYTELAQNTGQEVSPGGEDIRMQVENADDEGWHGEAWPSIAPDRKVEGQAVATVFVTGPADVKLRTYSTEGDPMKTVAAATVHGEGYANVTGYVILSVGHKLRLWVTPLGPDPVTARYAVLSLAARDRG